MSDLDTLTTALRYPWADGDAGVTLVVGGILTLLSPLVVPGLLVLGYGLRVVGAAMDGRARPPAFDDWGGLFVDGLEGAVVLVGWVVLPLVAGLGVVGVAAGAAGFRVPAGLPGLLRGGLAAGGLAFVVLLLLAGLVLVVSYLAPAALVHLGRTGRLGAAFSVGEVRGLAGEAAYGAAWLLALAVFAAASVVIAVLDAAAIGVLVSGFVTFYALVAMASLYAGGALAAGYGLEVAAAGGAGTAATEPSSEGAGSADDPSV